MDMFDWEIVRFGAILIGVFAVLVAGIAVLMTWTSRNGCADAAKIMGMHYRYSVTAQTCFVKSPTGWLPIRNVQGVTISK